MAWDLGFREGLIKQANSPPERHIPYLGDIPENCHEDPKTLNPKPNMIQD